MARLFYWADEDRLVAPVEEAPASLQRSEMVNVWNMKQVGFVPIITVRDIMSGEKFRVQTICLEIIEAPDTTSPLTEEELKQ